MIRYKFNDELGILETEFIGNISIPEMLEYIISIREDKTLPSTLRIFSDARNAKFAEKVSKKDLGNFLEENKITLKHKEFIFDAFIVSRSFETALGIIYREAIQVNNYKFDIFSTREAALHWLITVLKF